MLQLLYTRRVVTNYIPVACVQLCLCPLEQSREAGVILEVVLGALQVALRYTVLCIQPCHCKIKVALQVVQNELKKS